MTHPRPTTFFLLALIAAAVLPGASAPARAQIVSRFEVRQSVISPDGDGKQDSTQIRYALADTVLSVSLIVFEADSVTPVDTLRAALPDVPPTDRIFYWKGRRWDGSPVAEGAYVVTVDAVGQSSSQTSSLPVFVDVTPPTIQILSVIPDPYAPGLPSGPLATKISFVIGNASPVIPGRVADELRTEIFAPGGTAVTAPVLTTTPPFAGASGSYVTAWDATGEVATLADGEYAVTLTMNDAAGYTVTSTYHVDVDIRNPTIRVTTPPENARVRVAPDSLRGSSFDARGIDSLFVRYPSSAYQRVTSTSLRDDTTFFAVGLADSFVTEATHQLMLRSVDTVGRATTHVYTFTIDVSDPSPPSLDPFSGTWRTATYRLSGSADSGGDTGALVRIVRNGVQVDSVPVAIAPEFTVDVPLERGRNDIVAYQRDGAGNLSPPSNTITVIFEDASGLFIPAPFVPGGSFLVNASREAQAVALRVFDLAGDLVTLFDTDSVRQYYAFSWDGRNSSGNPVRKGPLVAVAVVRYQDGSRDVYREAFLYDPDAQ